MMLLKKLIGWTNVIVMTMNLDVKIRLVRQSNCVYKMGNITTIKHLNLISE